MFQKEPDSVNWFRYRLMPCLREHQAGRRLLSTVLLVAMAISFSSCNFNDVRDDENEKSDPDATPTTSIDVRPPDITKAPPTPTPSTEPEPEPEPEPPNIPLQDEPADDEFFADAAFMGNSLMNGFELYSGLTTPDYYTATSMTVLGATSKYCVSLENGNAGTMVDGLTQKQYGKIYILLGINEIGLNVDYFIEQYSAMLDKIMEVQENCTIYIMGISPVSMAKSSSDSNFNMTRVGEYNEALFQLAKDRGCYYMDLVEALADETGYLPAAETTDGVHFSANLYTVWVDYVRTHYVINDVVNDKDVTEEATFEPDDNKGEE